jgi:lipoprotein NlpD
MHRIIGLLILGWFGLIALSGCTSSPNHWAPVVSLKGKIRNLRGYAIVSPGETLFTIAKRSGYEAQTLAILNGINPPYIIKPGQKIFFEQRSFQSVRASNSRSVETKTPSRGRERTLARNKNTANTSKPSLSSVAQPSKIASHTSASPVARSSAIAPYTVSVPSSLQNSVQWRWPAQGSIIRTFQGKGKGRGIDIANAAGTQIKAAASGVVVYSGNGLKGYGNLIIIKHTEDFLSAYAHNRELRVKEGEQVCSGQEIAIMGQSGAECVKLHFEIRYQGKPVDPIRFLPRG